MEKYVPCWKLKQPINMQYETHESRDKMAKVYLIVGNTGAGKSTYSAKLAEETNAYIFTGDEWFRSLFFKDIPDVSTYEWALERTERIEEQILTEALKLLNRNIDVILDLGFFKNKQRNRVKAYMEQHEFECHMHYLDVDIETRWGRVEQRNTQQGDSFQFQVPRHIFEFCETIFEPLSDTERNHPATVLI